MAKKKRAAKRRTGITHVPTQGLYGWITHTDIGSHNPVATRQWCTKVLGWTFNPGLPMAGVDYQLFTYSPQGGGGIHQIPASETAVSIPYVHVADTQGAFEHALREGAEQITAPTRVMEGVTIAVVRAPGGVTIGFSGP